MSRTFAVDAEAVYFERIEVEVKAEYGSGTQIRDGVLFTSDDAESVKAYMPLLDTRAQTGDLTGRFVADLVLQILSYVAQKERENIKERQREGIASAKKRGVRFGRPSVPQPDAFSDIVRGYKEKAISFDEALSLSNMKKTTFYLRMNELCALSAET